MNLFINGCATQSVWVLTKKQHTFVMQPKTDNLKLYLDRHTNKHTESCTFDLMGEYDVSL